MSRRDRGIAFASRRSAQRGAAAAREASVVPASDSADPLWLGYQRRWQEDRSKIRLHEKGRRVGIDYVQSFQDVAERYAGVTNLDCWYTSSDLDAGREYMEYTRDWAKVLGHIVEITEGVEIIDEQELRIMSIRLPATSVNGITREPRISALSSNPRQFRGKGGDVRISEFAFHKDQRELWKAAVACTMWGGSVAAWSTHHGGHTFFNQLVQMGKRRAAGTPRPADMPVSLHTTTLADAIADGLVERINITRGESHTRESYLALMRSLYPDQAEADEELFCKPRGEAYSLFPFELLRSITLDELPRAPGQDHRPRRLAGIVDTEAEFFRAVREAALDADSCYAGVDIGRSATGDPFALAFISRRGGIDRAGPVLSWRGARFDAMEAVLYRLMQMELPGRARQVRRARIDKAGLGMQLAERAETRFRSRVEGVNTGTASVRSDLFTRMLAKAQERTAALPDDPALLAQFNSIRKIVTAGNHDRYDLARNEDGHVDEAVAIVLGFSAADQQGGRGYPVQVEGGHW